MKVIQFEPQVFDVLTQLVRNSHRVVTKEELFDSVWGGRFVGEAALTSPIKAVRRALGDDGESQRYIRTVRGRGYQFVGTLVSETAVEPEVAPEPAMPRQHIAFCRAADGVRLAYAVAGEGPPLVRAANWMTHLGYDIESEAWFSGNQADGKLDIKSRFRDTLAAESNGTDVAGDVTMNGVAYKFTATPVSGVAGTYTADFEGVRASWVVRPDGSAIGVQFSPSTGQKLEQSDGKQLADDEFRAQVRNTRKLQQAQQLTKMQNGSFSSTINGSQVSPTLLVTGTFRLS